MPKKDGQKVRIFMICKILQYETDEKHPITTQELIDRLANMNISCERKSVYDDINQLIALGVNIVKIGSRNGGGYYLAGRDFELAEIKLLVDAVSSSRFITLGKSRELIKKLEGLTSRYQASELQRRIFVSGRVKTDNESIYDGIDLLNQALQENSQITFQYAEWNEKKQFVFRKAGALYQVSPWALLWNDENYYLMAYDHVSEQLKHYRVDKISNVTLTGDNREGQKLYEAMDMAAFVNRTFGMFGGREEVVSLRLHKRLIGVVLDRFGKDIFMIADGEKELVRARVRVAVSGPFFGWLFGLGDQIMIMGPDNVKNEYLDWMQSIRDKYEKD